MVVVGTECSADSVTNGLVGIMVNLAALLIRRGIHAFDKRTILILVVAANRQAVALALAHDLRVHVLHAVAFSVGVLHAHSPRGLIKCAASHGVGVVVAQEAVSFISAALLLASTTALLVAGQLAHLAGANTLRDAEVSTLIGHATADELLGAATALQALGGLLGVMLVIKLGLLPLLHRHAVLLGELLVLLQVSLGVFPVCLADLAAALLGNGITSASAAPLRLHDSHHHLGHGSKALSAVSLCPCVPVSNALRGFLHRHAGVVRPCSPAATACGLGNRGCSRRGSYGSGWSDRGRASVCRIRVARNLACIQ